LQTIVGKSVSSFRREKEAYKAMSNHNHTGSIWSNVGDDGVNRHSGPHADPTTIIGTALKAGQQLIVLCYSLGDTESFRAPDGQTYTSNAWDFVVKDDTDSGGFVADVFIDTGGNIKQQLGEQGTCGALRQRLPGALG